MHLLTRYNFCFFLMFLQVIDGIYLFLPPPQIFCHNQINICTYNNDSIFCRCKLGYFKWRLLRANGQHYSLIWRILLTCWWPNTHTYAQTYNKRDCCRPMKCKKWFYGNNYFKQEIMTPINTMSDWFTRILQLAINIALIYNNPVTSAM